MTEASVEHRAPRRIALCVKYAGAGFCGFQRQPGLRTVQEDLELAWAAVSGEKVVMHASGRTDSGVHAWGQVVHFSTWSDLPAQQIRRAINAFLDEDVAVRAAAVCDPDFHSNASALGKHYVYLCAHGDTRPVLRKGTMAWHRKEFDLKAMREGAQYLIGRHDFKAFAAAKRSSKTTVRSIQSIHIQPMRGGTAFHFRGGGFLYRQVRNMVGSLWDVGMHKHAPIWLHHVLQSGDRKKAGPTAPAEGLYLWRVFYASDPFADYRRSTKSRIL